MGALLGMPGLHRQRLLVRSKAWIWDFWGERGGEGGGRMGGVGRGGGIQCDRSGTA